MRRTYPQRRPARSPAARSSARVCFPWAPSTWFHHRAESRHCPWLIVAVSVLTWARTARDQVSAPPPAPAPRPAAALPRLGEVAPLPLGLLPCNQALRVDVPPVSPGVDDTADDARPPE